MRDITVKKSVLIAKLEENKAEQRAIDKGEMLRRG